MFTTVFARMIKWQFRIFFGLVNEYYGLSHGWRIALAYYYPNVSRALS